MKMARIAFKFVWVVLAAGIAPTLEAQSLSEQIDFLFGEHGIQLDVTPVDPTLPAHTAHFSDASLATLGLLTQQLASSAADFPAISTVPGFTFRYNPQIQAFERSTRSLGPVFVERPQTLGRGKFDFGLVYLYIDFDELEGDDLDGFAFRNLPHTPSPIPAFQQTTAEVVFDKFTLRSHVLSLSATYGITDRWDVNILLPIVHTSLDIRATARITHDPANVHFFNVFTGAKEQVRTVDDSATGVGDLLLRTKYQLVESPGFNLASGLVLRLPTGDEEDLQGLGNTTLAPFFALAQEYGRFDIHASVGIEINTEDLDSSRARYAGGVAYQVFEPLALMVDLIGSSGLASDKITVEVPQFLGGPPPAPSTSFVTQSRSLRTDIIDLAVGFKVNPYRSVVGFVNVFVPLNDDGLRADVIPAAGLEISF
jgi:hypothetical protein